MKVHKWKTHFKWFSVCLTVPQLDYGTHYWKDVTCLRCKRKRQAAKGAKDAGR